MQQQLIGNREKAILHIAKAQLGMSEEDYRAMLASVGVSSSKELNQQGYDELLQRLKAGGFRVIHKSAKRSGMHRTRPKERERMLAKIEAILSELDLPWSYADGIARQMFRTDRLLWCDSRQTYKVLQALIMYQESKKRRAMKEC